MHVAVAQRDQVEAFGIEVALAVIRNVPAESVIADFVVFMSLFLPLLRRKAEKRRKLKTMLLQSGFKLFDALVDL